MRFNLVQLISVVARWSVFLVIVGVGAQPLPAQLNEGKLPTANRVGAAHLPAEIAAVSAPFAMPQFKKPRFPELTVKLSADTNSSHVLATKTIQAAIDEVAQKGGGTVALQKGIWETGRLVLKSNIQLSLCEGAELHFSGQIEDYLPAVFTRNTGVEAFSLGSLIYANGQTNIALTGKGKLIGPPLDSAIRKRWDPNIVDKIDAKTPVADRVYDGKNGGPILLPTFFGPVNCQDVYLEGVSFERTAFWNVVPVYCDGVIIRGITVNSVGIACGDGIDIDSSRNVLIEYSTLSCGDDCFTMKAGRGEDALRVNKPTENVVVRHCLALKGHGGITTGSESGGMIRNLYVHDCVFEETNVGIRFKTRRPRGGGGENLYYERIRIGRSSTAIAWDMLGSATYVGDAANRLPAPKVDRLTPAYRKIVIRDVAVEETTTFVKVIGLPESPATGVLIENVQANTSKTPIKLNDVDGFTLRNAELKCANNSIEILDGRNILFENCTFDVAEKKLQIDTSGELSKNIRFEHCSPETK